MVFYETCLLYKLLGFIKQICKILGNMELKMLQFIKHFHDSSHKLEKLKTILYFMEFR
jgi:hypothetical protein